jgi:hypothetical protein
VVVPPTIGTISADADADAAVGEGVEHLGFIDGEDDLMMVAPG